VAELTDRMGHGEYVRWQAFYGREPFGDGRGDIQTAMLMTLLANIHGKRGRKKPKLLDWLPDYWSERARPERLMAKLRGAMAGSNTANGDSTGDADRPARRGRQ